MIVVTSASGAHVWFIRLHQPLPQPVSLGLDELPPLLILSSIAILVELIYDILAGPTRKRSFRYPKLLCH